MMVMSKNRGKRIGRELVQKPFPGGTGDSEDQAGGVGYEFFKDMKMMGIGFMQGSWALSMAPPCPKVGFDVY